MRIRVTSDPGLTDTVMGIRIVNGVSETDFNQQQIEALKSIGRFDFEIIHDCSKCEQKDQLIKELELRIEELESQSRKRREKEK